MRLSLKNNVFLSNTGWQVACQIYSMLLTLFVGAFTARYLGPSNYGLIGYGQSIVSIFTSIATLGMSSIIVQDLVNRPLEKGKIIGTATAIRFASSFLCIILIDILILIIEPDNKELRIITLLQSFALVFQTSDVFSYWFQANLKNKVVSIGSMIAYTMVSLWRVILLIKGTSVEWFAASSCIQYLTAGSVVFFTFLRTGKTKFSFDINVAKSLFLRSYHFIFSGIAIALYTQMDKVMLGKMLSEEMVGYYTAATTIATMWEFVPLAIINTANIYIFKSKKTDSKLYNQQLSLLYSGISTLSIIVSICIMIFGGIAIYILYGSEFMVARQPLNILIWSTGFSMIGSARGSWIVAENLNKYSKYYSFISCFVNLTLNWLTIPKFGLIGAAGSTLASQFINAFIAPLFFKNTRRFVVIYFNSWKVSFAFLKNKIINNKLK